MTQDTTAPADPVSATKDTKILAQAAIRKMAAVWIRLSRMAAHIVAIVSVRCAKPIRTVAMTLTAAASVAVKKPP